MSDLGLAIAVEKRDVAEALCYSSPVATILCERDTTFGEN